MKLKKLTVLLFVFLLSIPITLSIFLTIDLLFLSPVPIHSKKAVIYVFALFIMIISITIFLFFIFKWILIFFTQLQKKTENLSSGSLQESVIPEANSRILQISEMEDIMQNLEKMRLSLINAQNQKSRFIMGISHDIRTPISIIKGYTEALSDGFLTGPEETKNGLDIISQKTQELEGITETLIDYMRMDLNELTEQLEPINAREVFHLFAKSSELTMPIYNRNYTYNIDIPENITILANKNLLLRALDNLFTNALHYTKNHDKIHFDAHLEDKCIKLSLEDSGIGMEKNELNNIFNIFYRGQNTNKQKGLGIGLTVVHDIVEIHKWKISCESEKGKGTTFFITIPLESYSDK